MIKSKRRVPLSRLTTFQTKGTVRKSIIFASVSGLQDFVQANRQFCVIGRGSNSLIDPKMKRGPIIRISPDILPTYIDGEDMYVNAGITVNRLMDICKERGLTGLEFTAGVPASLGGMIAMNFGCWGEEISDWIHSVQVIDELGNIQWLDKKDLHFEYRSSIFHHQKWVVLGALLNLKADSREAVAQRIKQAVARRLKTQPLRERTFGSVFKNPPGKFAGQLIESLGYKGRVENGVKMSEMHANFMVNVGEAGFQEARALIQKIQKEVQTQYGIELELEVQIKS
ncbi:MAG: UDP-N-acetylenolpyruvoylglucosamine reductase [Actinobacteria bacterium]|nr:UDP-N-acetylenolpyruvoylglucosamine reductase [Actinomycetota bacterium]